MVFWRGWIVFSKKVTSLPTNGAITAYFLNDAALQFPETLIKSVRNEIIHLYNNTALLFINGLHMEKSMLEEGKDLRKEIHEDQIIVEYDFNERYLTKVKPLFAAIIEYISKGQGSVSAEQQSQLFELRLACLKLSESIKAVNGLRDNVTKYFNSDNKVVRKEYNNMRIHIASVIKELDKLEDEQDNDATILIGLDELRVQIKKYRKKTIERLDKLIRNGEIDSFTATSILNDRTFTRDAVRGLLDAGKILFSTSDVELKKAEEMISLSEKEISEVVDSETNLQTNN